jgi:hypothetical protein
MLLQIHAASEHFPDGGTAAVQREHGVERAPTGAAYGH